MPPSRIGVLQPAREGVILEALIQADSAGRSSRHTAAGFPAKGEFVNASTWKTGMPTRGYGL